MSTRGQQQRIALARALAISPRVLLLDEPLSALDAKVREPLRDEIRRIQLELGVTTVFVTHDQEEALSMADRVGVMRSGRLEQCAPPAQLYEQPSTAFVAEFVGTMNRIPGTAGGGSRVHVGNQVLDSTTSVPRAGQAGAGAGPAGGSPRRGRGRRGRGRAGRDVPRRQHRAPPPPRRRSGLVSDVPSHRVADLAPGALVRTSLLDRPVLVSLDGTDENAAAS